MKVLVCGSTVSTDRLMLDRPDRVGVLMTPRDRNSEWWPESATWACDNDCFGGLKAAEYLGMLSKVLKFRSRPQWVSCPDVVADMGATWRNYNRWAPMLYEVGLPVALVLQDGIERFKWSAYLPNEWDRISAVFVGGSTRFKLSDEAARLTLEAHDRGKLVHYGRVNTMKRILWLARGMRDRRLWCDTFDGSGFSRFGDVRIPKAIRWIDKAVGCRQMVMAGGVA